VQVVGLRDSHTESDHASWSPLIPRTLPLRGPRLLGFAPEFTNVLANTDADLGYLAGLWKYPSMAAGQWSKRTGKPLMVAPHGMLDSWALKNSGFKKRIAGRLFQDGQLRRAACIRALCKAEAASIRAYGLKNPICVIPNGVGIPTPQDVKPSCREPFPEGKKVLLYLGRLHPKKGLANLLSAWSRTRFLGREWVLAIAGWDQGNYEATLKKQATELGIVWTDGTKANPRSPSLWFLGPRFGKEKEACFQSCDAFILPSFSEGLPMAVLEAWSHAKPVLMTPECNLPEGFAAEAAVRLKTTVEGIAEGLRQLNVMSSDELREMGRQGRELIAERFAWQKLADQMAGVYKWMLGGGPKPACVEGG
jgi:glycosyltransferase involved in cell wall biosynthesis